MTASILALVSCPQPTGTTDGGGTNSAPIAPVLQAPSNGAVDVDLATTLAWDASTDPDEDPVTYDVYLDETADLATPEATDLSETTYAISGLSADTTYYWKVAAKDDNSHRTDSAIWSFTTSGVRNVNPDFTEGGYTNWDDVYQSADDITNYLNKQVVESGDYVPEWTLAIGIGFTWYGEQFNIRIGPGLVPDQTNEAVYLAQQNNESENGVATYLKQTGLSYSVVSDSQIHIRFRIDESRGEDQWTHQAPLKISLMINGTEYLFKIYGLEAVGDGRTVVGQGEWYEDTIPLPGLISFEEEPHTIVAGDTISEMTVWCNEWGYKVYIDDFTLAD